MNPLMSAFHSPPLLNPDPGPARPKNPRQAKDQSSRRGRRAVRWWIKGESNETGKA
jgi:hypothetical protein